MNRYLTIVAFTFLFCLYGCIAEKGMVTQLDKSSVEIKKSPKANDLFKQISYVQLETNENCLIGEIDDIQLCGKTIFVLHTSNDEKELLTFTDKGQFLGKIGKLGNGPGEYLSIKAFYANSTKNNVLILDGFKKKALFYKFDGTFLTSLPLENKFSFVNKVVGQTNGHWLLTNSINWEIPYLLFECDEQFNIIHEYDKTPFSFNGGYVYSKNALTPISRFYHSPLSPQIQLLNEGVLEPAFELLTNSTYIPSKELEDGGEFSNAYISTLKKGYSHIMGLFETKKDLIISEGNNFTVWSKDKQTAYTCKMNANDLNGNNKDVPFEAFNLVCSDGERLVTQLTFDQLMEYKKRYELKKVIPAGQLARLITTFREDDNPILCFYTLR